MSRPRITSMSLAAAVSTTEVAKTVGCSGVAARKEVSSMPSCVASSIRPGSSTFGRPCSSTAPITVPHETPKRFATDDTEQASSPTARQHSARARAVRLARGAISSLFSVHERRQSVTEQRNRRLRQPRTTGLPAASRSRTVAVRLPFERPSAPQSGQNERRFFVSTASHTSPSLSVAAPTTKSVMPISTAAASLLSRVVRGLASFLQSVNRKNGEAPGRGGGCSIRRRLSRHGPPFVVKRP